MQENHDVVPLNNTLLSAKILRNFFFRISKKYAHPIDMYVDIDEGLYNQIFEKDDHHHIQIEVDIKPEKVDKKGNIKKSIFNVQTKKIKIDRN